MLVWNLTPPAPLSINMERGEKESWRIVHGITFSLPLSTLWRGGWGVR